MKLLTKTQREQLLVNGRNRDRDHLPVVKFFDPCGAATWLFAELDPADGDTLFGLADLGCGTPELGYTSLAEIASVRSPFGLGIERDLYFKPRHPLLIYAEAARAAGRIVEIGPELEEIANRIDSVADGRSDDGAYNPSLKVFQMAVSAWRAIGSAAHPCALRLGAGSKCIQLGGYPIAESRSTRSISAISNASLCLVRIRLHGARCLDCTVGSATRA